ncbi:tRNA-specific adenosine deaminase 1 [Diutina catenulata]
MDIATAVLREFDKLKPGEKPQTRSNGQVEWSVLAGVCLLTACEVECVTVATGVKVMPDCIRDYSEGMIVQDCHAEILALRAFNWWVLDKLTDQTYFEIVDGKYNLKKRYNVILYISEPPCGDASMAYVAKEEPAWKRAKFENSIIRGRAHYDRLGVVRTKPGRADSIPTKSKSCSDKLALKQKTGLLNSLVSSVALPIFLDKVVVPSAKLVESDMTRSFGRLYSNKAISIEGLEVDKYEYCKGIDKVAADSCVVKVVGGPCDVLVNGVKRGAYRKGKPPKLHGRSFVSNQSLWQKLSGFAVPTARYATYTKFKEAQTWRQDLKRAAHCHLGGWEPTSSDDFELLYD